MIAIILSIVLGVYLIVISLLIYGFTKIKNYDSIGLKPKTVFTIIVPFRDEADNLPILLDSFSKLNYPTTLFQVILVDDESKEKFQVSNYTFQISIIDNIRQTKSPKKDAILTAIDTVNTDWVITTDADCVVTENWLLTLDNYIQTHTVSMIAGAVTYDCNHSFLQQFQQLDIASLQGATIGSFGIGKGFMCNGANLAYTKSFFQELNGFDGNDKIASGDDVFLLQKAIAHSVKKVYYLKSKNNIVTTKPLDDWKSLFHQRVRWAAKTTSYQSGFGKGLGIVVFMGNLGVIIGCGLWVLNLLEWEIILVLLVLKYVIDALLIFKTNIFSGTKTNYLIRSSLLYPFFSVAVALYSVFGKYEWKGRKFPK
ncbi:glycosyltransferase [Flavobacterium sp. K5-23]|uniref:glycosyltransferase family 2 protein n=1 Tax=Flavobacterium sp. K5-23 TaxID=2746225 RepID=UPI00201014F6|nr:glycosyltransferase [Flavobacterium sp. K5-23]UQD55834.1 glycosyltransferase [Flavobacterium sp. K5-23]